MRHVVDARRLVDGEDFEASTVPEVVAGSPSFRSPAVSVRFELARRRALAVEVDGPVGDVRREVVPPLVVQPTELLSNRLVALRQGHEVLDKERLELDVSLVDNSGLDHAEEALVGVVGELLTEEICVERGPERCRIIKGNSTLRGGAAEVPNVLRGPWIQIRRANDHGAERLALAVGAMVPHANKVVKSFVEPPSHLVPRAFGHEVEDRASTNLTWQGELLRFGQESVEVRWLVIGLKS